MPVSRSAASKNPGRAPTVALLIVLLAAALTAGPPKPITAADVSPVVAAANGSLTSGAPGPSAVFPVTVSGVQNLGAASVLVGYDPASLKPVACQRGPAFDVGVCNLSYDRDGDGTADAVLFAVLSLNGVSAGNTAVPLANITWQAVAAVQDESVTVLTAEVRTFTDTAGRPLAHTAQGGQITLLPPPPPTMTPTPTLTPTATETEAPTPTATATPTPTATVREPRIYLPLVLRAP